MRNLAIAAGVVLCLGLVASPVVKADSTSLQDSLIVISGPGVSVSADGSPSGSGSGYTYTSSGFAGGSPGFLGGSVYGSFTVTVTASSGGTYYIGGYFDPELSTPYYNEFAAVNGSTVAGQSYEVGDPVYSNIYTDTQNNTLSNANALPAGSSNFDGSCAEECVGQNGDVALAIGFTETLVAGDKETVTFTIGQSATGGFYIEQSHPTDGANSNQTNAFFSATESVQAPGCTVNCGPPPPPPPPGVPEPSSLMLLGTSLVGLLGFRKKLSN